MIRLEMMGWLYCTFSTGTTHKYGDMIVISSDVGLNQMIPSIEMCQSGSDICDRSNNNSNQLNVCYTCHNLRNRTCVLI